MDITYNNIVEDVKSIKNFRDHFHLAVNLWDIGYCRSLQGEISEHDVIGYTLGKINTAIERIFKTRKENASEIFIDRYTDGLFGIDDIISKLAEKYFYMTSDSIEKMDHDLREIYGITSVIEGYENPESIAEALYEAGYRRIDRVSESIIEIFCKKVQDTLNLLLKYVKESDQGFEVTVCLYRDALEAAQSLIHQ